MKVDGKVKDISIQKDILGLLATKSHEHNSVNDIRRALTYPLAPVPFPLGSADGTMRKTKKANLYGALETMAHHNFNLDSFDGNKCYIFDLVATLRSTAILPQTLFGELALKLLNEIPTKYNTTYVACDTYCVNAFKSSERNSRGCADRLVIRSPKMRIPATFQKFLNNGENKDQLFGLIEIVWMENCNSLNERSVLFCWERFMQRGVKSHYVQKQSITKAMTLKTLNLKTSAV